jgi:predicted nucleic acid-binding protein
MDLLVAAQAIAAGAVLVANHQSFARIRHLEVQDWTVGRKSPLKR